MTHANETIETVKVNQGNRFKELGDLLNTNTGDKKTATRATLQTAKSFADTMAKIKICGTKEEKRLVNEMLAKKGKDTKAGKYNNSASAMKGKVIAVIAYLNSHDNYSYTDKKTKEVFKVSRNDIIAGYDNDKDFPFNFSTMATGIKKLLKPVVNTNDVDGEADAIAIWIKKNGSNAIDFAEDCILDKDYYQTALTEGRVLLAEQAEGEREKTAEETALQIVNLWDNLPKEAQITLQKQLRVNAEPSRKTA